MTWADGDIDFLHARESLANRYPGEVIEILDTFDVAYVGWECDFKGALITRDGRPEIVIVSKVGYDDRPDIDIVREQLAEYRRLIAETERVLERYQSMGGLEGDALDEAERRQRLEAIAKGYDV